MRGNISLRAVLVLSVSVAILGLAAGTAGAAVTVVDTVTYVTTGGTSWTIAPGYAVAGVDKLVVTFSGEAGWPHQLATITGATYAGAAMTPAIKIDNGSGTYEECTIGIFYLDNPGQYGATGDVVVSTTTTGGGYNGLETSVIALAGTAPGMDVTNSAFDVSTSLTPQMAQDNAVIAATMNGAINTSVQPHAVAPLVEVLSARPNAYTAGGSGYQTTIGLGTTVTPTFTPYRASVMTVAVSFPAAVPSLYWDIDGNTPGAGGATPAGTWDDANTYWNTEYTGGGAPANVTAWSAGNTARFGAGADANGTYVVTVEGPKDITGLGFDEGTVTLAAGTSGELQMSGDSILYVAPGAAATIETPISDDGSARQLYKSGAGTLTVSGDLTHTGGTTVAGGSGMLILSGNNVAATGGMTLNGGVAQFESSASINGTSRDVAVNSGGTAAFGASFGNIQSSLTSRIVDTSAGTVALTADSSEDLDFSSAGADLSASLGAVGAVTYTGALTAQAGSYRLGGGGGTLIVANTNAVTGSGSALTVCGGGSGGSVVLSGANDYDGGTTLVAGTLAIGDDGAIGTGGLTFNGGGISSDSATARTIANAVAFTGDGSFSNAVNTGKVTLTGTADLGADTRTLTANSEAEFTNTISGSAGLIKAGDGVLALSGTDSSYSGATIITGGTLAVAKLADGGLPSGLGSSSNSNANLQFAAYTTLKYIGAGDSTDRSFRYTGTFWTGRPFTIDASGTGPINFTSTANPGVTVSRMSYTLNLIGSNTGDNTLAANLANTGNGGTVAVTKDGPGKWVLTGTCTNSGDTTVNGGTLEIAGTMNNSSAIVNNSGSIITGGGSVKALTINTDAGYTWGYGDGGDHVMDIVHTTDGHLTLNDLWVLNLVDLGDDPDPSETYDLFTFAGNYNGSPVTGPITLVQDANYTLDTTDAPDWDFSDIDVVVDLGLTTGFRVYVTGIAGGLAGDADENGVVDAADYIALKTNMGQPSGAVLADGDFDKDGDVDWYDLQILQGNYGAGSAGAPGTIPEPGSAILLMFGAAVRLGGLRRRRAIADRIRR